MAVSELKITINGTRMQVGKDKITTIELTVEINSTEQLEYLINKVRRLPDIIEVKRLVNEKKDDGGKHESAVTKGSKGKSKRRG